MSYSLKQTSEIVPQGCQRILDKKKYQLGNALERGLEHLN